IGLPYYTQSDQIIFHTAYTLKYSEQHEQASWVAYTLKSSHTSGTVGRTDDFRIDYKVKTGSASLSDYKGSGYDRGHLAPAGDMKWSSTAMSESFYMSNMSPQHPSFNRGIWKKLEGNVRNWADDNGEIFVVTGPFLNGQFSTIGYNRVSIPNYYYKVILDYREPELKGIGFILPNQKSNSSLQSFAVTIDEVENRTGINFFHALPDEIEKQIESSIDVSKWSFRSSSSSGSSTYKTKQEKLKGQPKININTASKSELMKLPRIGPITADKILVYRSTYGYFRSLNDLQKIKGIGPKTVEKLRLYAIVY
ncbi:MAG: DNA/RNA non-specific endonuclease, partial [Bacteroidetes bacterium]|nr:DNA/RNA non-specific endonuclease [Bacteroidota bacterium]